MPSVVQNLSAAKGKSIETTVVSHISKLFTSTLNLLVSAAQVSVSSEGTVMISWILSFAPPISTSLKSVAVAVTEGAASPTLSSLPCL